MDDRLRMVDVHGFGGGFTLGAVQAGFDLVAKKSLGVGFGVLNCLANRALLGNEWEVQSEDPDTWTVEDNIDLVGGNPPCSGFSTMSRADFRGMDSAINECMWQLIRYAAKVKPKIVIFESVQQTYRQGLPLMRALRDHLEEASGLKYDLVHVLHNNAGLGGAALRKRYFWVATRVPFGVTEHATRWNYREDKIELYDLDRVPPLNDVLVDLAPLSITFEPQSYGPTLTDPDDGWRNVLRGSWWTRDHCHDGSGIVDGHGVMPSPMHKRIADMFAAGVDWQPMETMSQALEKLYVKDGRLPDSWRYMITRGRNAGKTKEEELILDNFWAKQNDGKRWDGTRLARVVTGGTGYTVIHPTEPRTFTQREIARIQGFPDAWKIWPVRNAPDLGPGWGKGVPVHAGRWIAHWARQSILGQPGDLAGEVTENGDRERKIDITESYRPYALKIGDPGW